MSADDRNCTGRFGVDAFCLALHGADLHIWSGAWSAQHGKRSYGKVVNKVLVAGSDTVSFIPSCFVQSLSEKTP